MSKEHAYAYEAGYRDGSIHYELEHCPACKNVADLQEALAENAKLQDELEFANDQCERAVLELLDQQGQLKAENAKLRELCAGLLAGYECGYGELCKGCTWDGLGDSKTFSCLPRAKARDLGVEVDA